MSTEPTLADDERQLANYAGVLHTAVVDAIPDWVRRLMSERVSADGADVDTAALKRVAAATTDLVAPELMRVLDADVDDGAGSPLEAVRAAVGPMTDLLQRTGAAKPPRDEFVAKAFPNDPFDLGPAAFSDISAELHEPGLVWGAARAHVHLRRRREHAGEL
ncbi:MAG: hypothetical protein HOM37_11545 [Acidimicrobiaceae bacterium]|jgi:hypothetical protein|nr:hypothetical protein [Acidimicrobiaceae bacterium]MBT5581512.1 hypothetical protein [Acidimicrobiaceae bacterium]